MAQPPPPPPCDVPEAADQARRRLTPQRSLLDLFRRKSVKPSPPLSIRPDVSQSVTDWPLSTQLAVPQSSDFVNLDHSALPSDESSNDVYRWAIIYENQRGLTLFSTPYYSPLGLLPLDPPAFTLLDTNPNKHLFAPKSHAPSLTPRSYPLPDGNWHWVSKSWMVDMRDDVQYDGFQYNWAFRKTNWRSTTGNLSAGALVRRRRWVRLMMKPAKPPKISGTPCSSPVLSHVPWHASVVSSYQLSTLDSVPENAPVLSTVIWEGNPQDAWIRCRDFLKTFPSDGKKLEVWQQWLGYPKQRSSKAAEKQWTEDEGPLPSQTAQHSIQDIVTSAPHDLIVPVIRENIDEILKTFIYPESRAGFLTILGKAGVLADFQIGDFILSADSSQSLNFWSYKELEGLSVDKGKGKVMQREV